MRIHGTRLRACTVTRPSALALLALVFLASAPAVAQKRGGFGGGEKQEGPSPERMIRSMDSDRDGRISREEWRQPQARFDAIDVDKDGFLTKSEIEADFARNERGPAVDFENNPMHPRSPREVQKKAGMISTGLEAVFLSGAGCPPVASSFGATTRYDGSSRSPHANYGLHGGIDISAPIGTPLIAVADGEVVHKYVGGLLIGNQIFLRHTPEDTGLSYFVYSKYKHFDKMPGLEIGARVKMGQVLGPSGNTGTAGKHYGPRGYPHLHLSIYASDGPGYRSIEKAVFPDDVRILDPILIYLPGEKKVRDSHAAAALPAAEKRVAVPYMMAGGKTVPAGARIVWPFVCKGT